MSRIRGTELTEDDLGPLALIRSVIGGERGDLAGVEESGNCRERKTEKRELGITFHKYELTPDELLILFSTSFFLFFFPKPAG
jgi:hypothetical protein